MAPPREYNSMLYVPHRDQARGPPSTWRWDTVSEERKAQRHVPQNVSRGGRVLLEWRWAEKCVRQQDGQTSGKRMKPANGGEFPFQERNSQILSFSALTWRPEAFLQQKWHQERVWLGNKERGLTPVGACHSGGHRPLLSLPFLLSPSARCRLNTPTALHNPGSFQHRASPRFSLASPGHAEDT